MLAVSSGVDVSLPPYFQCPISLDLMQDPVTLCTGISYDRPSIERWIQDGHNTCPYTGQILWNHELIPNLTLHRLIQAWRTANGLAITEIVDLPVEYLTISEVQELLFNLVRQPRRIDSLQKLRSKAAESKRNGRCIANAGAVTVLVSILSSYALETETSDFEASQICEEIIGLLVLLPLSDSKLRIMAASNLPNILSWLLEYGTIDSKLGALTMLENLMVKTIISLSAEFFSRVSDIILNLLQTKPEERSVTVSLRVFLALCSLKRGKARMTEAGASPVLINLLLNADVKTCEQILASVELLCRCAEGREAFSKNALALPCIAERLTRVSTMATTHAVNILWLVCKFCADERVRGMAVKSGVYERFLWILMTDELTSKTKQKVIEVLKMLKCIWENYCTQQSKNQICHRSVR
ncbi:hypothetical protein O6H91_10G041900 [Diphasiastrum complanatum]|uniref:Uncharacterized protein n=1 Tax=Diphasiastrum complanatum TaxID=34168 RepID=A0ACC2CG86_DIPCM|nr:hypothetical protein O6H91_10G041900 [Diphasiastrum complanatum]